MLTKIYGADVLDKSDCKITDLVDRASNGQEAVDIVRTANALGCTYSLIFMDCSMPILDGYESTKQIRQYHYQNNIAQPMIIACTGHTEPEYMQKAWAYEMDEVLAKPIQTDVIIAILEEMVDFYYGN